MTPLPIEAVLPELRSALRAGTSAVLQAPPGAGKTTGVPLALLDEPWLAGRGIVILAPRRLAARAAAHRMASLLGESVGGTVGYRVRLDTRVGPRTRIEVVTEGVLTRMLQEDPALERMGIVIFDEFHERSLHADLGLALTLQSRAVLRADLRVLVMSATLDGARVAALLDDAPIITSEGRSFPVAVRYLGLPPPRGLEAGVAAATRAALAETEGDVLVFLPGAREIRRTADLLAGGLPPEVRVRPLHGLLPVAEQEAAIAPSRAGGRKVVLATSIAETSLTIEGVRVVVDAGLARVPRFSPRIGLTRLATTRVTRASAEQRRGRAGRLAPGECRRLWSEAEQAGLRPEPRPEILEADLAPLALELAAAGVTDPAELRWLDPPPAAAFAQGRELLRELGALDAAGRVTPHGRRMAELAFHPRLAHMILAADRLGLGGLACDIAALLGERDPLRRDGGAADVDLQLRLELLAERAPPPYLRGHQVDRDLVRRIRAEAAHWRRRLGVHRGAVEAERAGVVLAFAYPDRIAQRRPGAPGRFLLRNGLGAAIPSAEPLTDAPYLVAAELDGKLPESRIFLAAALDESELETHFGEQIEREELVAWDPEARAVRARARTRLGAIVLAEGPLRSPDPERVAAALLAAVEREGLELLPWTDASRQAQQRLAFARALDPSWPDRGDEALRASLGEWLAPHLRGLRTAEDLARLDLAELLLAPLSWERRRALDELAPTHLTVPSGSRIRIDYADPAAPALAVRLQELFGLPETPRIGGGRVPVTLHLLSPAHRPVQVTRDLASFWRTTYFDVRKDLKGRYPKHPWPDDPLQAEPTRRPKRGG